MIAMMRDEDGRGVRVDRIDGWEPKHNGTRVYLAGGQLVDLLIKPPEFIRRLDRALTAMAGADQ